MSQDNNAAVVRLDVAAPADPNQPIGGPVIMDGQAFGGANHPNIMVVKVALPVNLVPNDDAVEMDIDVPVAQVPGQHVPQLVLNHGLGNPNPALNIVIPVDAGIDIAQNAPMVVAVIGKVNIPGVVGDVIGEVVPLVRGDNLGLIGNVDPVEPDNAI